MEIFGAVDYGLLKFAARRKNYIPLNLTTQLVRKTDNPPQIFYSNLIDTIHSRKSPKRVKN